MSYKVISPFEKYHLSQEEYATARKLTELQRQYYHNLRTDIAMEKLSLTFTLENQARDAELQGQLGILDLILQLTESEPEEFPQDPI